MCYTGIFFIHHQSACILRLRRSTQEKGNNYIVEIETRFGRCTTEEAEICLNLGDDMQLREIIKGTKTFL